MNVPDTLRRAREVFEHIYDTPASDRDHALDAACADDAELRREVEALLLFDSADHDALADSVVDERGLANFEAGASSRIPERIGNYRVVRRIAGGGMGDVFEAIQDAPERRVAIKVMHPGGLGGLTSRFAREGRIQARLQHPGIAQVYETGVHDGPSGRLHYIVMEFVDGHPISQSLPAGTPLREILGLMLDVCDAVGFAHQRGVIHRDLKPANILVTQSTSSPRVKVLDFGVAKLTTTELTLATMHTSAGQMIGTLAYMSPEQFGGRLGEVDTRTDIYSLGLILFELLAGRLPHSLAGLSLPQVAGEIARGSTVRLGSIAPQYRGDLETIIDKAIERDKTRRYDSVPEFASDLRRFLNREPVSARPPTAMYHLSRFASRNRALVSTATVGIAALIAGIIGTSIQSRAAVAAREVAEQNALEAKREAETSRAVAEALRDVFFVATPTVAKGEEPTLRRAIDITAQLYQDKGFDGPPEAEAIVRNVMGIVFRNFGELDKSRQQFETALTIRERVLPASDPDLADSLHNLAVTMSMQGDLEAAIPLLIRALEAQKNALGPDDPKVARSTYNLGKALIRAKRWDDAHRTILESLEVHSRTGAGGAEVLAMHHTSLATIERARNNAPAAVERSRKAVEMMEPAVGDSHPSFAVATLELAECLLLAGDLPAADVASRTAWDSASRAFATLPNHQTLAAIRDSRVRILRAQGRNDEADALGSR